MRDPAFELNCFLTRSVYRVIAAVMLGCLSTYEGEARIALAALGRANGDNGGQAAPPLVNIT